MASNIAVSISVDTTELSKLAVAKASFADLSSKVRQAAREMSQAGAEASDTQRAQLEGLISKQASVGASVQAMASKMRDGFKEAGASSRELTRVGAELTRLGHELVEGDLYRAPVGILRLVGSLSQISPVALEASAAIAALAGGLGLLGAREAALAAAIRQASGSMALVGTATVQSGTQIEGMARRAKEFWGDTSTEANASIEAISKLHGPVSQYAGDLLDMAHKQALIDQSSPSKNVEEWVGALNKGTGAAVAHAEAVGFMTGEQKRLIAELVAGGSDQAAMNAIVAAASGQWDKNAEALRKYAEALKEAQAEAAGSSAGFGIGATPNMPPVPQLVSGTPTTDGLDATKDRIAEINSAEAKRAALAEQIGNLEAASMQMTGDDANYAAAAIQNLQIEYQKLKTPAEELAHATITATLDKQLEALRENAGAQVGIYRSLAAQARAYYGADSAEAIGAEARVIAAQRAAAAEALRLTVGSLQEKQAAERNSISAQIADQDRIIAATKRAVQAGVVGQMELQSAERRRAELLRQQNDQANELQVSATTKMVDELDKQLAAGIKHFDQLTKEHKISAEQQGAVEKSLTQVILGEEIRRLQAAQSLRDLTLAQQQDLATKIKAIQDRLGADEIAITDKTNTEIVERSRKLQADLKTAFEPFSAFFDQTLTAMFDHSQKFNQQVENAFGRLVARLVAEIAELAVHWAAFQAATSVLGSKSAITAAIGNPLQGSGLGGVIGGIIGGGGAIGSGGPEALTDALNETRDAALGNTAATVENSGGILQGIAQTAASIVATIANTAALWVNAGEKLIPFAGGGIVTKPTMALVGEAGPEAIIPLSAFAGGSALASVGAFDGPAINMSFGMREFGMPDFGDSGMPGAGGAAGGAGGAGSAIGNLVFAPNVSALDGKSVVALLNSPSIMRTFARNLQQYLGDNRSVLNKQL